MREGASIAGLQGSKAEVQEEIIPTGLCGWNPLRMLLGWDPFCSAKGSLCPARIIRGHSQLSPQARSA